MKIVFFEVSEEEKEYLKCKLEEESIKLQENEAEFFKDPLNEKNVKAVKDADIISVFIYSDASKKILNKFEKLKAVLTRSTGYDHIDVKHCDKNKIRVLNVSGYGENTVAEHTFALILALARKIPQSYERTKRGNFSLEGLTGFELKNKTIGIIGTGAIGSHVARIAHGFGMNILGFDVKKNKELERKYNMRYVSVDKVLKNSDIVTLHCPLNSKTKHLINRKRLKLMKENAYLINTSRGGIIDTKALVKSLVKGEIAGAGLDVLEQEKDIKEEMQLLSKNYSKKHLEGLLENHVLLTFNNVIITPHNAFNSKEAAEEITNTTLKNIKAVIKGRKSENSVKSK